MDLPISTPIAIAYVYTGGQKQKSIPAFQAFLGEESLYLHRPLGNLLLRVELASDNGRLFTVYDADGPIGVVEHLEERAAAVIGKGSRPLGMVGLEKYRALALKNQKVIGWAAPNPFASDNAALGTAAGLFFLPD